MNQLHPGLAAQFDRIDFLTGLGGTTFFTLEHGSTLFVDDLALGTAGTPVPVRAQIEASAQHFGALQRLLDAGSPPRVAAFALLRAAIETAATAIWLLEPHERDERLRRVLRTSWADLRNAQAMTLALTGASSDPGAEWARAHSRWFPGTDPAAAQAPVDAVEVVSSSAEAVEAFTEVPGAAAVITTGWSGFGRVSIGRFPADGEMFAGSLSMALDVAETAISLFHARAVATSSLPDDAATLLHLRGR
jgi:hypothetical protein